MNLVAGGGAETPKKDRGFFGFITPRGAKGSKIKIKVGLYNLNADYPYLESARFQPLNLKCDFLVSKFAFTFNTCTATSRAITRTTPTHPAATRAAEAAGMTRWGAAG